MWNNRLKKLSVGFPYCLFMFFAVLLIFFRMPWIDESWYAGPAITFMREGSFLTFGCGTTVHAYGFEPYALLEAAWYSLGKVNLIWIRFLNVLLGLFFLLTVDRCLKFAEISSQTRTIAITLGGINYFFLYAATQNRPEIAALLASVLGLLFYLTWRNNPKNYCYLSFSSFLLIVSTVFHLQAAFTELSLWVTTLIIDRNLLKKKQILAFFAPYVICAVLMGVYLYPHWKDFINYLYGTFVSNKMLGHSGGMFSALSQYWNNHEFVNLLVALVLIASPILGMSAFNKKSNKKSRLILFIFASGGYISWLGTTTHINDYHACWLSLSLIISMVGAIECLRSNIFLIKVGMIGVIFFLLTLGACSVFFVFNNVKIDPYRNIYYSDLNHFSSRYRLLRSTVGGVRDIQWYFKFSTKVLCPSEPAAFPEYYILNNDVAKNNESALDDGHTYFLLQKGRGFSIYQLSKKRTE